MSTDELLYCAPCRIRVLVVPIGEVRKAYFSTCLQLLRRNGGVPFRDMELDSLSNSVFNPTAFPQGQMFLECTARWEPEFVYLEDLQHWRKLFAIIGVKEGQRLTSDEEYDVQLEALKAKHKSVLVHRILDPIPDIQDTKASASLVRSFLKDLCVRLLLTMSEMGNAIRALPTIRSPVDPFPLALQAELGQELKRPASVGPGALQRTSSSPSRKQSNRNTISASHNASSEELVEQRGSSKGRGRVLKVLADLSLLCGVVPGAMLLYNQSIEILRLTTDYVWHASALEGVGAALVLLAYLKVEYTIPGFLSTHEPTIENSEPLTKAPAHVNNGTPNKVLHQSVLDVLQDIHGQVLTLYDRSFGSPSLEPAPPILLANNPLRIAKLLCDAYASAGLSDAVLQANVLGIQIGKGDLNYCMYPPSGEIAKWAMRARDFNLEYGNIPVSYRMRVFTLLAHIMDIIGFARKRAAILSALLDLLAQKLVQVRVMRAAESGLHPTVAQTLLKQLSTDGGLVGLLESLVAVYGATPPRDDKDDFGWPCLKTYVLKQSIAFCEALPNPRGVANFISLLFAVAGDYIEKEEQIRFAGSLSRMLGTSRKSGIIVETDYWDPFVVRNIEIVGQQIELSGSSTLPTQSTKTVTNPFLYSAHMDEVNVPKKARDPEVELIARTCGFFKTMKQLSMTEGVATDMSPSSFILPAQSSYTHSAPLVPRGSGLLVIKGCTIRFSGCRLRDFKLWRPRNHQERDHWYDTRGGEDKIKSLGLPVLKRNGEEEHFWLHQSIEATVLAPQPVLTLDDYLLRDSSIMLLEGETKEIPLRLRNLSDSSMDYVSVKFRDSTSTLLKDALSSALAEDERSEVEYFLYDRPAFVWASSSQNKSRVNEDGIVELLVQINGKRGLTHGAIDIEYASISPVSQCSEFPYRHLDIGLSITVNASIELLSYEFLPLSTALPATSVGSQASFRRRGNAQFLLVLEMRNSWIRPLSLVFSAKAVGDPRPAHHLLYPGQTRRIALWLSHLVPLSVPEDGIFPPPKMRDRQFVVSLDADKDRVNAAREAWWYRQQLLDSFGGTWEEKQPAGRTGQVELRGIRLNEQHIKVVRNPTVEATTRIRSVGPSFRSHRCIQLTIEVKNHRDQRLTCCLHVNVLSTNSTLSPLCKHGLDRSPVLNVPGHGTVTWSTEVTLLGFGWFEIGTIIEERSRYGKKIGPCWAGEVCLIEIVAN